MKAASFLDRLPAYIPIEPFEVLSARYGRQPEDIIKLDANENPYGMSPRARQALANLSFPHIYPDPESRALRSALEAFTGVSAEYLVAASGVDELIDLLLRVLLEPGDRVLICPPTFGMYGFDAFLNAGQPVEAPRRPDFSLDPDLIRHAVRQHKPKVLFIATPNNPDGGMPSPEVIDALLDLPVLVVLDEAYIEFSGMGRLGEGGSRLAQVSERDNLVVMRTFSKWAGLAGLRVGYGAFPRWLLPALWKAKQPYNVNVAASAAAIASLEDLDYLADIVARLRAERRRLAEGLAKLGRLQPYPSCANFALCKINGMPLEGEGSTGSVLKTRLAQAGVLVRYFDTPRLRDHIRITAGRPEETDALIKVLGRIMSEQGEETASDDLGAKLAGTETAGRIREEMDYQTGAATVAPPPAGEINTPGRRTAIVKRSTRETRIEVSLDLDGSGSGDAEIRTGLGFLDHMLHHIAVHGQFDLAVNASGDLDVDAHHTVEDVALVLGQAFDRALGERAGIVRIATATVPMDEALAFVAIDFSGRPYASIQVEWHTPAVGQVATSLFDHFLESFAVAARCNLHARLLSGRDDHHQAEALFKALGRALSEAVRIDPRRQGAVPSTKGVLV